MILTLSIEQKARDSNCGNAVPLSPRSRRLIQYLPKPRTLTEVVRADLSHTIAQVAFEMGQIQRVQSLASSFIRTHFERKSPDQVKVDGDLPVATALSYTPHRSYSQGSGKYSKFSISTETSSSTQRN